MRETSRFWLLAAMLFLLAACDKSDPFMGDLPENNLKKAHSGCTEVVVEPEAGFDTENFLAAFEEAKNLGPGTIVRLTEGTYTIGMIEVHDFDGELTGAGKGKTIITNRSNLPCDNLWNLNQIPALLTFVGGNVAISEMTFRTADGQPCQWTDLNHSIYGDLGSMVVLADYSESYVPANRKIDGLIHNVDFIAGNDGGYGTYGTQGNVAMLLYCGSPLWWAADFMPLSNGNITVSDCSFVDGLCGPDFWAFDENSVCRIHNNTIEGGFQQIFLGCMSGSKVYVTGNTMRKSNYYDIYIYGHDQGYYPDLNPMAETRYTVTGNRFHTPAGMVGIFLYDGFRLKSIPSVPLAATISGNVFENEPDGVAIQSFYTKNATIKNNLFKGTGNTGIWLDGDEATQVFSEENSMINNDFRNASYTNATVYLGPVSRDNKVVGVSSDVVVDEGINNKIVGTKAKMHGNPLLKPMMKGPKLK